MEARNRLHHIDLLESLAMFFVVFYHCSTYTIRLVPSGTVQDYVRYFFLPLVSTCVPLFFFANGYLLFHRPFNLRKHIRKILRLVLLLLIWPAILMPLYLLIAGEPLSLRIIVNSILDLDTAWSMNLLWFLEALICIYILFPALKALFDTDRRAFLFLTVAIAIVTFGAVLGNQLLALLTVAAHRPLRSLYHPLLLSLNPFHGAFGYSYVYFCVGGLLHTEEERILAIRPRRRNLVSVVGILVSCSLLFLFGVFYTRVVDGKLWDVVWNGYDTIFTFCNVVCLYVLSLSYTGKSPLIKSISCNTLGIYFTHILVYRLTRGLVRRLPLFCTLPGNLIYVAFILGVCLLFCLLLRRIPILRKLV